MSSELTQIIAAAKDDSSKSAEAFALLAGELRNLAASKMRNLPPSHTLQPTALVNEAFIRLMNRDASWESRGQFFMFAARAMRDILVEHARRRAALKRGGDFERIQLDALSKLCGETDHERILSLHNALSRLEVEDDRAATIVHLRFVASGPSPVRGFIAR